MAGRAPPDYYKILEIPDTANSQQIRDAYKRAALNTHPDRVAADSPERAARTRKFQLVNDAYYALSDPTRRREYDAQRRMYGGGRYASANTGATYADPFEDADPEESVPPQAGAGPGGGAFSWAWNFFTGQNTNSQPNARNARQQAEDAQFGDVFEEMLREEGLAEENNRPTSKFWSILGAAGGGVIGFIVANAPGAMAGAVAGNRLGAIRDTKGKSVYAVFQDLPQNDRARLLAQLATRVFSHAVGI
ncbi:DnaJ-domain-containing protein [Hypoxylon sp. FL1150]|nr:DnaJ-domain-containing protein [Hypoxylon sp. FL1150]